MEHKTLEWTTILTEEYVDAEDECYEETEFELDSFQKHARRHINNNEHILITAHTGSGKTKAAEFAIEKALREGKRVIYASPLVALSNQKFHDFKKKYGYDTIGLLTGFSKINPDAPCLIMTTEIYRNQAMMANVAKQMQSTLYRPLFDLEGLGCIIFDEVHYMSDEERGYVWEESLMLTPNDVTIVMLSATISCPEYFTEWLGLLRQENVYLIPTTHRVVPLKHFVFNNETEQLIPIAETGHEHISNYSKIEEVFRSDTYESRKSKQPTVLHRNGFIQYLFDNGKTPAIEVVFSKEKCRQYAQDISGCNFTTPEIQSEINNTFNFYMSRYKKDSEKDLQFFELYDVLLKGIGYHHSGMLPVLKEMVEILFSKGLIAILFGTETLTTGLNLPARTVIFTDMKKRSGNGFRNLKPGEYTQISGRAGRRNIDIIGYVIHLPSYRLPSYTEFDNIICGKSGPIISKFKLNYAFVLGRLIKDNNINYVVEFCNKTLLMTEMREELNILSEEKQSITEQINISESAFTDTDMGQITQYYEAYDKIFNEHSSMRANKRRKEEQKLIKTQQNINNFETLNNSYQQLRELREALYIIENKIDDIETYSQRNIQCLVNYMETLGYFEQYDETEIQLTSKGFVASVLNGVNELLLTELIHEHMFDNLDFSEIMAILAGLLSDSTSDDMAFSELEISENLKSRLCRIREISDEMAISENRIVGENISNWNIDVRNIEPTYRWANNEPIVTIEQSINSREDKNKFYSGNFSKLILRLTHLCETINMVFEFTGNLELLTIIDGYYEKLMRDQVNNASIYVDF
jgi:superfamily II RNA helicase